MNVATVLFRRDGRTIYIPADNLLDAHLIAQALSAGVPGMEVDVWRGAERDTVYREGREVH